MLIEMVLCTPRGVCGGGADGDVCKQDRFGNWHGELVAVDEDEVGDVSAEPEADVLAFRSSARS